MKKEIRRALALLRRAQKQAARRCQIFQTVNKTQKRKVKTP